MTEKNGKPRLQTTRRIMAIIGKLHELSELVGPGRVHGHIIDALHNLDEAKKITDAPERERYLRAQNRGKQ